MLAFEGCRVAFEGKLYSGLFSFGVFGGPLFGHISENAQMLRRWGFIPINTLPEIAYRWFGQEMAEFRVRMNFILNTR